MRTNEFTVSIYSINGLTIEDASYISWLVGKEFIGGNELLKIFNEDQWLKYKEFNKETKYVLAKNLNGEILGFDEIYSLNNVMLNDKEYNILGTGSLIAFIKGKGIGTLIVKELNRYLESQDKSALGFCEDSSLGFHKKMNREIWIDGGKKLICNGKISTSHLIVFRGEDGFIEDLEDSERQAIVPYDFW